VKLKLFNFNDDRDKNIDYGDKNQRNFVRLHFMGNIFFEIATWLLCGCLIYQASLAASQNAQ